MQQLLWFAVNAVIFLLTWKKPQTQNVEAGNFDVSSYPESKDKSISCVFGKALIKAPNTIWAGGERSEPIKEKQDIGFIAKLMGVPDTAIVGHRYYTSMDLALAFGPAKLTAIYEDEKKIYSGNLSSGTGMAGDFTQKRIFNITNHSVSHIVNGRRLVPVDALDIQFENVRGSKGSYTYNISYKLMKEDGVIGRFEYFGGNNWQSPSSLLRQKVSQHYPAYKGLAHIVFDDMHVGQQPIPKKLSFELAHYPPSPMGFVDNEVVDDDANPAYVIYELMAHAQHAGVATKFLDIASVEKVAQQCKDEGLGISFVWSQPSSFDSLITKICDHCDLTRRENHETGKVELIAIRPDYNIDDLFAFDETNIHAVSDYSKPSLDALNTQIKIKYLDRAAKYKERNVVSHNIGLINNDIQQNQVNKDYTFFCKASLAQWAADRDLVSMTNDISTVKLVSNRDAAVLNIGDAVKVKLPIFDEFYRVYRIQSIDLGSLENNKVTLDMVEDVFGRSPKLYAGITGESSEPGEPTNANEINLFEVPTGSINVFTDAPRSPGKQLGYNLLHATGNFGYVFEDISGHPEEYTDEVYLQSNIEKDDDIITLQGTFHIDSFFPISDEQRAQGSNLAVIVNESTGEHEYISYGAGNAGGSTVQIFDVWRGLFDTQPMSHSAGSRVFLFSAANAEIPRVGGLGNAGVRHNVQAATITETGSLTSGMDEYRITQSDRYTRPNSPINAQVSENVDGKLEVTFKRRPASYASVVSNDDLESAGWVRVAVYDDDLSGGIILPLAVATVQADTYTWEGDNGTPNLRVEVQGWDPDTSRSSYYKSTLYHSR
ncbi:hypothetical protein HNO53_12880 [Billgrantia antri]|uniref:Tip attachment protein J domain-containing protein n=1 Tax=Halomonas sulfidivorans TaxID=2733488 RepID=A0ABX7WGP5_9GAMM|nr:phage tail protein [Halomonas sulfidivorans]QTP59530.1 hypothetical protein HNO53_12880 [Halomonas sulfidivorans]